MKRFILAAFVIVGLSSCDDVERSETALQANINNSFYKSNDARAIKNEDGSMTIQGFNSDETLTLHLARVAKRTFNIEEGSANYATYENMGGMRYTTQPNGTGQIVVSELDEVNNTVSGTFKFEAFLHGIDTIFVEKGVFFEVPFSSDDMGDPNSAGRFSAKVNGSAFEPITVVAKNTGNSILVSGNTANTTISISVPVSVEAGEYTLPRSGFTARYQDATGSQNADGGEIIILEHTANTKTLKGSFSFVTADNEITEGSFEVVYE